MLPNRLTLTHAVMRLGHLEMRAMKGKGGSGMPHNTCRVEGPVPHDAQRSRDARARRHPIRAAAVVRALVAHAHARLVARFAAQPLMTARARSCARVLNSVDHIHLSVTGSLLLAQKVSQNLSQQKIEWYLRAGPLHGENDLWSTDPQLGGSCTHRQPG